MTARYDPNNVFAKILRREIPAQVVYEDQRCLVFRDIAPAAPTHLLVIPKVPLAKLADARAKDGEMLGHLLVVAARVAVEAGLGDGFRIVINNGEQAGQTVFHLHLHVLGGRNMGWPPG